MERVLREFLFTVAFLWLSSVVHSAKCNFEDLAALNLLYTEGRSAILISDASGKGGKEKTPFVREELDHYGRILLLGARNVFAGSAHPESATLSTESSALTHLDNMLPNTREGLAKKQELRESFPQYNIRVDKDAFPKETMTKAQRDAARETMTAVGDFLAEYHVATGGNQTDSQFKIINVVVTTAQAMHSRSGVRGAWRRHIAKQKMQLDKDTGTLHIVAEKGVTAKEIRNRLSKGEHFRHPLNKVKYKYFNPIDGVFKNVVGFVKKGVAKLKELKEPKEAIARGVDLDLPVKKGSRETIGQYLEGKEPQEIATIHAMWTARNEDASVQAAFERSASNRLNVEIGEAASVNTMNKQFGVVNVTSEQVIVVDGQISRWVGTEKTMNPDFDPGTPIERGNKQFGVVNVNNNTAVDVQLDVQVAQIGDLYFLKNLRDVIAEFESSNRVNASNPWGKN